MDTDSIIQLIAIVILLVLSAFFSSAETSFITVNRIKVLSLVEEGNKRAALVIKIIDQPAKMLSAVLIGNNIVNISCSALATSFTISVWGNKATGIVTGVLTLLVLIFGGAGFVAKVLFASNKNNGDSKKNNKSVNEFKNDAKSIDDELDAMKKNIK